jgi:peptidoglycan/xylan/chitin deacetylase (PgdA/CDA1 family)
MTDFISVMYHQIRKNEEDFFPKLISLKKDKFKKQLNYLEKNYHIANIEDLKNFFLKKKKFKKKLCMLTFDDGYLSHYTNVFPILKQKGLQGFFFPPSKAIENRELTDQNKAQLLLASNVLVKDLNNELENLFNSMKIEKKVKLDFNRLKKIYKKPFGFDDSETIFFKRMLQVVVPINLRTKIFDILIKKYINKDQKEIVKELYLTMKQAREMVKNQMFFGNHCHNHLWLESEKEKKQEQEILAGIKFLKKIGMHKSQWIMCYPYGSYNKFTIKILKRNDCFLGLTTINRSFDIKKDSIFEIPRIDCNNVYEY